MTYTVDTVDTIQFHMLHLIAGIMDGYNLNPAQVQAQYESVISLKQENVNTTNKYDPEVWAQPTVEISDSTEDSHSDDSDSADERPMFVETRREFCLALSNGKKICPSYSSCASVKCKYFHINPEFICNHVTRGSYCDEENCELIVIRACRKGKRCNDDQCSFRH